MQIVPRFDPEECACKGTKIEQDLVEVSKGHFARVHKDFEIMAKNSEI